MGATDLRYVAAAARHPGVVVDEIREAELIDVERELGVTFPVDYRTFAVANEGVDRDFGGSWLMLYRLDQLVDLNRAYDRSQSHPGLVFIGSDGGGEGVGFDFRQTPPSVVLVNWVSSGWTDALVQGPSFEDFMEQRTSGMPYNFGA